MHEYHEKSDNQRKAHRDDIGRRSRTELRETYDKSGIYERGNDGGKRNIAPDEQHKSEYDDEHQEDRRIEAENRDRGRQHLPPVNLDFTGAM